MRISAKSWAAYVDKLSRINTTAANMMQAYIDANGMEDAEALIDYAHALVTKYGEASGALACEMYDAIAITSGKALPAAEMAALPERWETAKAVQGTIKNKDNTVPATVGRMVKQEAADTTLQNAERDQAYFAWIPTGDTCAFCLTLASRGWQKMSKRALKNGHAEHIHANCDCEYAISFDKNPQVEGYDPQRYREIYDNAEGSTSKEKINALRRAQYDLNGSDVIEVQHTEQFLALEETAIANKIKKEPVRQLTSTLTDDEIIQKIGGGDRTKGSCSSLALSYAGNKNGIDVTDFRGGNSQAMFARTSNIMQFVTLADGQTVMNYNGITGAQEALAMMEQGKQYYFFAGQHAAIVRRTGNAFEYLELQTVSNNGWHELTTAALRDRFGVKRSRTSYGVKLQMRAGFFDIANMGDHTGEFSEILGYINTAASEVMAGAGGYAK